MRVFYFNAGGYRRYIDLDHVLEVNELYFAAKPSEMKQDKDGINYWTKSSGEARFSYALAFFEAPRVIEVEFTPARHNDEQKQREESEKMMEQLEAFRSEFRRFLNAWRDADTI